MVSFRGFIPRFYCSTRCFTLPKWLCSHTLTLSPPPIIMIFSSHALFFLYMPFCGHISLLCHLSWALASQRCQPLLCSGTNVTWSLLAGPIFQSCCICFTRFVEGPWFPLIEMCPNLEDSISDLLAIYLSRLKKILGLAGFEPHSLWDKNFQSACSTIWASRPRQDLHLFMQIILPIFVILLSFTNLNSVLWHNEFWMKKLTNQD